MKTEQTGRTQLWTLITAAAALVLGVNFLVFLVLLFAGVGMLLEPAAWIVAAVFLLLGLAVSMLSKRREVRKLWRRILTAAIACNFLIIAFTCAAAVLLISYLMQ